MDNATSLLKAGKPFEAAAVLGALLAKEPKNAVAAHLMGLALKDTGDLVEGEKWLRFSILLQPNQGEFHSNLGNLLRKKKDLQGSERAYREALKQLPWHRDAQLGLALTLCELNRAAEARDICSRLLQANKCDAEAWEAMAIALTSLGFTADAELAHRQAIDFNPNDAIAHHNLGTLLSEIGHSEAMASFETARRLGVNGYETAYHRARAAINAGDLETAQCELESAVRSEPLSGEAQKALAQVRFMRGDPAFARDLGAAVRVNRDNVSLQHLLAELLWRTGELTAAETLLRDLAQRNTASPKSRSTLAMVLLDQGRLEEAEIEALEAATVNPDAPGIAQNLVTILIARDRAEEAEPFIAAHLMRNPWAQDWLAFDAMTARMLDKPRYHDLCDYERFIQIVDAEPPDGFISIKEFNQALAAALQPLHHMGGAPLDHTVRNGMQTSRTLHFNPDPTVQSAIRAFHASIEEYRRKLTVPAEHPLAKVCRGSIRFKAAWSVRSQREGFHINHIHTQGLVSSAYYVQVPDEAQDTDLQFGWLKFGEPSYAPPRLAPDFKVQPKPGRLVLFPSYMWHGTSPIHGPQERICIAFDATTDVLIST